MSFYESTVEQRDYFYFSHVKKETETPPHFHGAVEFLFCIDGKQEVCIGGKTQFLEKGDACFIDSYTVHSLKPSGAELYAIVGDVYFFQSSFAAFENKIPTPSFSFENPDFLSFLYSLYRKNKNSAASVTETNKAIAKLLLVQLHESVPFVNRRENKQNELVASILQYSAEHFKEDLSLSALALRFGYSPTYLSRVLHRYLGVHWSTYLSNLRVRAARALLRGENPPPVLTVALSCGFDSLNTFYRAYRRVFRDTPTGK